jgi:SulP family sulfate permease
VLGLEARFSQYRLSDLLDSLKPGAVLVAVVTVTVIWTVPRYRSLRRLQPTLLGLAVGMTLHHSIAVFHGTEELGPTLGTIVPAATATANAASLWEHSSVSWLLATAGYVLPYSAFLALQAIMNAAVTSTVVSEITGVRPRVNRTLIAQGFGNVICGVLAALPIGTSPSQSMVAARMKGISAIVPASSCVILLGAVLAVGELLAHIPVAALAGILVTVGIGMVDRWARSLAGHVLRGTSKNSHVAWNLVIVAAVAAAFVFGSVPLALAVGAILATLLLAVNLSEATTFGDRQEDCPPSTRAWPREQSQWLATARRSVAMFRPRGGLFFGTADQLSARLAALPAGTKFCVLDLSRLTTLDSTGCQIVAAGARKLAAAGTTTVLAGLDASRPREQALIALGLTDPDPATRWFADLDHALEWVEMQMLKEQWPRVCFDGPVALADSPLAKGLSPAELDELQACLQRVELPAGPLFRSGDPGSSMYVVDEGFVEIRIGEHETGMATRLAAFGPGSIFGEIAMLSSDQRTADAVCVRSTRLYELRREKLVELQARHPALYARIVANLGIHLANRLVATTGIVQAHR